MRNGIEKVGNEDPGDQEWKRRLRLLYEIARRRRVKFKKLSEFFKISEETVRYDIELLESMSIPLERTSSGVTFGKGRPPDAEVYTRRLQIVGTIFLNKDVSINDLEERFQIRRDAIERDVEQLGRLGIPVKLKGDDLVLPPVGIEALWKGTVIGDRFARAGSMAVKRNLADAVVTYLSQHRESISSLMFGNGSTAYMAAERILALQRDLGITAVYTANVLVLHALAVHQLPEVVRIAGGQLDREILWLHSDQGIRELREKSLDAAITSFMSLSKRGFWTQQMHELDEKLMNLQPHPDCRFVLIPIEWSKLAHENGTLVAPQGSTGEDAFDFRDGHRKYVIFTDAPDDNESDNDTDRERFKVLEYWEGKDGVEVVRVPRPKEMPSEVQE